MGKVRLTILLLLYMLQSNIYAADSTVMLKPIKTITGSFSDFTVDNLGNIYLVTSSNQIKKLNAMFDSVSIFNDVKRYGNIYSIDASNPLKVLVYYKEFLTIVILDRFLNAVNTIDLRKQNIVRAKAICQSYDNNVWVFDELDAKIKKLDDNGKLLLESTDFRMLFDTVPNPSQLLDNNGLLYLYNSKNGFAVFDYYGGLKSSYSIIGWVDVQIRNGTLLGRDSHYLYQSRPQQLFQLKLLPTISLGNAEKTFYTNNMLYILKKGSLEIYSM